jgi:hypothetical protein
MQLSIRVRLTAWYLGVVALATFALGAGSWWLLARGITRATDERFSPAMRSASSSPTPWRHRYRTLADGLREYADLPMAVRC